MQVEHLLSQLKKILLAIAVLLGSCSCASGHLAAISVSECDLLDECMNVLLHALLIVTPRYCCRIFWKLCTSALWTLTRVTLKMIQLLFSNCLQMLMSLHIHCLQVFVNKLQSSSWIVGCVQTLASYSKKYMLLFIALIATARTGSGVLANLTYHVCNIYVYIYVHIYIHRLATRNDLVLTASIAVSQILHSLKNHV